MEDLGNKKTGSPCGARIYDGIKISKRGSDMLVIILSALLFSALVIAVIMSI